MDVAENRYPPGVPPFHSTECLLGPEGLLLVGAREPGTRVVRRTRKGFFELALPFEPTRHRPVAWEGGEGGAFRIAGRNGEELVVDGAGELHKGRITNLVLAGIASEFAVGIGPRFFEREGGIWTDVTPEEEQTPGGKLDFRAMIGRTKLVLAIAAGPTPTVFVDGSYFRRLEGAWAEHRLEGRRVVAATATARGTVYAATTTGALLRIDRGEPVALPLALSGARVHALAVSVFGLLVAAASGLFLWREGKTSAIELPGEGPVTDVSAYGDVEVCVREGTAYTRRLSGKTFGGWSVIAVPPIH